MAKETPFDRARDFVEEKIDQTKEILGDSYTRARDEFDDLSDDMRKNAKSTAKRLEKDYGYLWTDARKYIRENPGTSIAISLGAGLLLGFLLRGDDD
ncbi:MAG TPA: hypothetical protein VE007_08620 [Thermoanaerobaculia bacterium]|jgi:ElaB/YqjD/DUF883 family membrane-anchored ribosome-binding protein|nr:hypothetical protein [Thermoanaerobaculia bacterium]